MKKTVLLLMFLLFSFVTLSSPLLAAAENGDSGSSFLLVLFIGFFALIVVFQLVPACLMFFGMVRGLAKDKSSEDNKTITNR